MVRYVIKKMYGGNGHYIKINNRNGAMMLTNNMADSDLTIIPTAGDGNCFFNALAKANITFLINNTEYTLSDETKEHIIPNIRRIIMHAAMEKYKTIEKYNAMADNKEKIRDFTDILDSSCWMNGILISILQRISNLDIIILNVNGPFVELSTGKMDVSRDKILALILRSNEHYNGISVNNVDFLNKSYDLILSNINYIRDNRLYSFIKIIKNIMKRRKILKPFSIFKENSNSSLIIDINQIISMFNVNCNLDCNFYILEYFIACANSLAPKNGIFNNFIIKFYNLLNIADINVIICKDNRLASCFKKLTKRYNDVNVLLDSRNFDEIHNENLSKKELSIIYTNLQPENNIIVYNLNDDAIYIIYKNALQKYSATIDSINIIRSLL